MKRSRKLVMLAGMIAIAMVGVTGCSGQSPSTDNPTIIVSQPSNVESSVSALSSEAAESSAADADSAAESSAVEESSDVESSSGDSSGKKSLSDYLTPEEKQRFARQYSSDTMTTEIDSEGENVILVTGKLGSDINVTDEVVEATQNSLDSIDGTDMISAVESGTGRDDIVIRFNILDSTGTVIAKREFSRGFAAPLTKESSESGVSSASESKAYGSMSDFFADPEARKVFEDAVAQSSNEDMKLELGLEDGYKLVFKFTITQELSNADELEILKAFNNANIDDTYNGLATLCKQNVGDGKASTVIRIQDINGKILLEKEYTGS